MKVKKKRMRQEGEIEEVGITRKADVGMRLELE